MSFKNGGSAGRKSPDGQAQAGSSPGGSEQDEDQQNKTHQEKLLEKDRLKE